MNAGVSPKGYSRLIGILSDATRCIPYSIEVGIQEQRVQFKLINYTVLIFIQSLSDRPRMALTIPFDKMISCGSKKSELGLFNRP